MANKLTFWILAAAMAWTVSAAAQQGPSLVGAWSWDSPGQYGMDHNTVAFNQDGTYLRVSRWANGTMTRFWGNYSATPVSPTQFRLQSQTTGWLPAQFCSQAPGFPARCSPAPHPPEMSFTVAFTSPSSFQAQGMVLARDPSPFLLQQQVPQMAMTAAQAPVQPNIQQPVMPTLHPYQTPNGPGQGIANANHQNAQDFINGNLRQCYKAADGTLYGCQQ